MIITIISSIIIGTIYYYMMESSIPRESNCSFITSIYTDIFAFIFGFILIYIGFDYNNKILVSMGVIIIVEHIWQFLPKYFICDEFLC